MTDAQQMLMQMEGTGPMSEGRFFPYVDSVGKTTIGYGHNLDANGLPSDIVMMLLLGDMDDALDAVRHNCSCYDQLSRARQLVLISLGFQFGKAGLAQWVRFLSAVHLGHYDEAADHLLDSKVAREQAPVRFRQLATMMRDSVSAWT